MEAIDISTPAIVFPALSVLMLAYTNRFIAISKRVRSLHEEYLSESSQVIYRQISVMHKRLTYIRNMQILAIFGFLINVISIFLILLNIEVIATYMFATSLIFIAASLGVAMLEIYHSVNALSLQLDEDENQWKILNKKV
jgi:hypothetical protein